MREVQDGTRWMTLALFIACAGSITQATPPAQEGRGGGASLVRQDIGRSAALPASASSFSVWSPTLDAGEEPSTRHDRRSAADRPGAWERPNNHLTGPTDPNAPRRGTGFALLGLSTAPANAPPSL